MATSSPTGPLECHNCGDDNFSLYMVIPELLVEPEPEPMTVRLYGQFATDVGEKQTTLAFEDIHEETPTVDAAVHELAEKYPALREHVLEDDGHINHEAAIFHNHVNVFNEPDKLDTVVRPGDQLALFPSTR